MARRGRKQRKHPFTTVLLVALTVAAGTVMLYLFTTGIGLQAIERTMQELLESRWEVVAVPPLAAPICRSE